MFRTALLSTIWHSEGKPTVRTNSTLCASIVLLALTTQSFASGLEKQLTGQWLGAWVVTTTGVYSDCANLFTNNRVNDRLVKSNGAFRLQTGELAKVQKVNLVRSRLDVPLRPIDERDAHRCSLRRCRFRAGRY